MTKNHKPLAAIDLGTNSFHLLIVDADTSNGRFKFSIVKRKSYGSEAVRTT